MKKSTFYRAIGGKNSPLVSDFAQALANWDKSLNEVHSDDGYIIVTQQGSLLMRGRITPDVGQTWDNRSARLLWSELKQILSPENLGGLVLSDKQISDLSPMARISMGFNIMNADELRDKALVKWAEEEEVGLAALYRLMDLVFDETNQEENNDD